MSIVHKKLQFLGGLLLIGICNLISAIVVMQIARKLYGRYAGLVAGLLFLVNIGWAQGYFVMTEPFTILFLLLATYFALFTEKKHYLMAGLSAGIAIGFKQYALIAVPLLLLALYLNKETRKMPAFLAGVGVPLLVRQYLHYWALALPFLAILWAGWLFKKDR